MKTLDTREKIAVIVSIVVVFALFFGNATWRYVSQKISPKTTSPITSDMKNISTTTGIEIYDLEVGTGAEAVAGKVVAADYIGTFTDGTKFDSSLDRGTPYEFTLGTGEVIKGWDIGIAGMKVGGVRGLIISPEYAYGAQALGPIPANSTLVFQVKLMGVK